LTVPPNVKTVNAEPKPASRKKTSPDEEAIRGATESFTKAFNASDAKAVAALQTPAARVVDVTGEVGSSWTSAGRSMRRRIGPYPFG
jgi:hypothetical protein